ncbi:MAG: 1-deoxy-D-xylulose-5-phosphate reductoisomerase [Planctomycetes bacterium]|nr:1-deoxy-D-xylulose-5-phosphate reductoisomerase [Planctomycetota bacterium]
MKSLLVLGSSGSIGRQTLEVVRAQPGRLSVAGLAARGSWELLAAQAQEFRPRFVALTDAEAARRLAPLLPLGTVLFSGPEAVLELCNAAAYDVAVHGIVGAAGLPASVAVLARGKDLALANKESLVLAGAELVELARTRGATILPVDSELCAIFQCLRGESLERVRAVHLTASGGPFRDADLATLEQATPAGALRHPTWSMGPRISIGSATLMNKALEVLEVHHLFGVAPENVHVWIHRQSVIHSMVEFVDGSVMAQLGPPDMRGPLHYCLFHPERAPSSLRGFQLDLFARLSFETVDPHRFPALALGYDCARRGGDSGAVLNGADEVLVEGFLAGKLRLTEIAPIAADVLAKRASPAQGVAAALRADRDARALARLRIDREERAASTP